ncbi:uncharacterized protein PG998_006635 [Apiospora kogelbergensis]|uniref:uncharacterized protein n=1 Tax=Apiospora kogelbergensis TaxID=1337665 RepID=UPI00312E2CF1
MLLDHNRWTYMAVVGMKYSVTYVGLGCLVYFFLVAFAFGRAGIAHPVSIAIEAYGAVEILWYFVWFLPFKARLQRPGMPMTPMTRAQRRKLVADILRNVPDVRLFIRKWFCMAHLDQIHRDNVKDWLAWALFAAEGRDLAPDEWAELDEYAMPMRLNLDPVVMYHRPLLWYLFMSFTEVASWAYLAIKGFTFYRQPRRTFFSVFPFRPMTLLAPRASASEDISYFCRPHRSKTHRPVLFIHGIGIGVPTYATWLPSIPADIGVVAVEILPASNRICPEAVPPAAFARAVAQIVQQQGMDDFVLVGHSYGTFMARPLLEHPEVGPRINSLVLCDPVAVLLHLPDVAYNITRRRGRVTPEIEIDFGAGRDPMIAYTVCRRFHWPEHILFREDLAGRRTTAVVAGRDCVLNGPAVASYMHYGRADQTSRNDLAALEHTWTGWTGRGDIELLYLPDRDHGQSLLLPQLARRISEAIATYADKRRDPGAAPSLEPKSERGRRHLDGVRRPPTPPEQHRGRDETVGIPLEDVAHHSLKVRTLEAIKTKSTSSSTGHSAISMEEEGESGRTTMVGSSSPDEWRNTHFIESYASSRYSVPDPLPHRMPKRLM